jgi:UDP-N-acetylglucosamine--N-acetylmuramyl-(pentapeptide) pyrophosphoryl-undecaprenol N-acetylglucosamine transferase
MPPPVRKEFIVADEFSYDCDENIKIIVIGGSQGATSFSRIMPKALSLLDESQRRRLEIVQQVSFGKIDELQDEYDRLGIKATLMRFINNTAEEMRGAQLVICRAGASTLAELSALGRPAILIPYPLAAKNHQYYNAMLYKGKKAAWVVEENETASNEIASIIANISKDRDLLKTAASNMHDKRFYKSTDMLVEFIEKL